MRGLHKLSSANECCGVKENFTFQSCGCVHTHRTALIMNNIITKFHTKARMGPAGNTTGRWLHGVYESVVMSG